MYHLAEAYLMAAYICLLAVYVGALTFGAAAVAPTAVRLLDAPNCALFLRSFWVTYHRLGAFGGIVLTLIMAAASTLTAVPLLYTTAMLALASCMTLCFWVGLQVIPSINAARDRGDEVTFIRLHRMDLILVSVGLLFALALMGGLVYVLPGQFTFWPTAMETNHTPG
ncbi:MAG: hypothetical protein AAF541_10165 [Pseudomonadota bacterium]